MTGAPPFRERVAGHDYRRGAPMGRPNGKLSAGAGPVHLGKVPIDAGGYDPGGAYWGAAREPLWCAWQAIANAEPPAALYFRAPNREAAKADVLAACPTVRFHL